MKHFKRETNAHGQVVTACCSACRCPFSSPSWWLSYPCFWFWLQSSANLRGSISTVCCLCWAALYFISFLSTTSLDGLRKSQVSIKRGTAVLLVKWGKPSTPLPHLSWCCHGFLVTGLAQLTSFISSLAGHVACSPQGDTPGVHLWPLLFPKDFAPFLKELLLPPTSLRWPKPKAEGLLVLYYKNERKGS